MITVQQVLTNASREGVRGAVLDGATTTDIESTVNSYLTSGSIVGADTQVDPNPPSNVGYGEPVTVTVAIGFDEVSWLPTPMFVGEDGTHCKHGHATGKCPVIEQRTGHS